MDPNANLESQLELARDLLGSGGIPERAAELAEHVIAMHSWIRHDGFLPDAWTPLLYTPQIAALARLTNDRPSLNFSVTREPFGLPDGYWQVLFEDGFECGIAPDGSVSS